MVPQPRSRGWCFTYNNPTAAGITKLKDLGESLVVREEGGPDPSSGLRFLVYQSEQVATWHLQGYLLYWGRGLTFARAKVLLPDGCHIEVRHGTHGQARDYCTDEEKRHAPADPLQDWSQPIIYGEDQQPADGGRGARSDLVSVKRRLDEGASEVQIADEFFGQWVRYNRSFTRYMALKAPPRNSPTITIVYWGEPGTGKTRRVSEEISDSVYWLPKPNSGRAFWDGYEGQEDVVIDEFFGWLPRDLCCRLCDRYPFRVETKGGSVPFSAKRIFITSNNPPSSWWPRVGLGPMHRRLSGELGSCFKMTQGGILSDDGCGLDAVEIGAQHLQPDGSYHIE